MGHPGRSQRLVSRLALALAVTLGGCDDSGQPRSVRPSKAIGPNVRLLLGAVDLDRLAPYGIDAVRVEDDHVAFVDVQGFEVGGIDPSPDDGRITAELRGTWFESAASDEHVTLACNDVRVDLEPGARLDDSAAAELEACSDVRSVSAIVLASLGSLTPDPAQLSTSPTFCLQEREACWATKAGRCAAPVTCLVDTCTPWWACHPT